MKLKRCYDATDLLGTSVEANISVRALFRNTSAANGCAGHRLPKVRGSAVGLTRELP